MKGNENIGASRAVALAAPHICEVKIAHHEKAEEHGPHDSADKREDHRAVRSGGSALPSRTAKSIIAVLRQEGIVPRVRQAETVDGGAPSAFANFTVPPTSWTN